MLEKYNALIYLVILLFLISGISALWGGVIFFQKNSEVNITSLKSIIPTTQSGSTEFNIPLPISGLELPITVLCTLTNLTNSGIIQNTPIELTVNFTFTNNSAIDALAIATDYIYIESFTVNPVDAIQVSYLPNLNSTASLIGSYQPSNPAEFSSFSCQPNIEPTTTINNTMTVSNTANEVFVGSDKVVLQDTGLLNLQIEPTIFAINPSDPIWKESNLNYYIGYNLTIPIPISIISTLDANQQNNEIQQQKLQNQQTIEQNSETRQGNSLALWILAFASLDIGIALYDHSENKNKKAENETGTAEKNQGKITKREIDVV